MRALLKRGIKFLISPWVSARGARGCIYLSFDDGPHPLYTPAILDVLRQQDVKATFFMIGEEMEKHPAIVAAASAQGHAIGFHSYRHQHLAEQSGREVLEDLQQVAGVARRLQLAFTLYRPPYGEMSVRRLLWCVLHRVRTVMWSLESRDSFTTDPADLIEQLAPERVRDGDIILLHDDTAVTVSALPTALERLRTRGFRFGLLSS